MGISFTISFYFISSLVNIIEKSTMCQIGLETRALKQRKYLVNLSKQIPFDFPISVLKLLSTEPSRKSVENSPKGPPPTIL